MGHSIAALGALHGLNALALFSTAAWTGLRAKSADVTRRADSESAERVAV
jgi:hypothetical protein